MGKKEMGKEMEHMEDLPPPRSISVLLPLPRFPKFSLPTHPTTHSYAPLTSPLSLPLMLIHLRTHSAMPPRELPRLPSLLLPSPDPQRRRTHDDILQGARSHHLSLTTTAKRKTTDKAIFSARRVGNGGRRIEMEERSISRHSGTNDQKKKNQGAASQIPQPYQP